MVYNIIKVVKKAIKVVISGELSTWFSTQCGKLLPHIPVKTVENRKNHLYMRFFDSRFSTM